MSVMQAINPANGDIIATYQQHTAGEVARKVDDAGRAFAGWSATKIEERAALLPKLAAVLEANKERYARLMTAEMGKPIKEARAEVEKCAWACKYYAEHGPAYLADDIVRTEAHKAFVAFRPLGVVLAVMPWNFPFWQVLRFAIPSLLAGNAALLKHAGETYLPFLAANARALREGAETFEVELLGQPFAQAPFRYQGKCFDALRKRLAALPASVRQRLDPVLEEAGCLRALA